MSKAVENFQLDEKAFAVGDDVTDADKKKLEAGGVGHLVVSDAEYKKLVASASDETTDDDE